MHKSLLLLNITVFPRKDDTDTIYFSSTAMWLLFEGGYYSKYRCPRLLLISPLMQCGDYSRAATIRGAVFIQRNMVFVIPVVQGSTGFVMSLL